MRAAWAWPLAVVGGSLLALWGTWPLGAHLTTDVYDPTRSPGAFATAVPWDIHLTLWILAWDVHALATSPSSLFDANVFHPARWTLAGCEDMLGALPVYLPLAVVSRDPVLAHQATLLLTFVLAFLAAVALVRDWTGSWPASLAAGALFAFSRFRVSNLGVLEVEGNYWLPLIPLFAQRAVTGSRWWSVALAGVLVLVSLHSYYLGYAAFLGVATLAAVTIAGDATTRARGLRLAATIGLAALAVGLTAIPYLRAGRWAATAGPAIVEAGSATPGGTGATSALVVAVFTAAFWRRGARPGIASAWIRALAAMAVVGHAFALGPTVRLLGVSVPGPYRLLASLVPGFSLVRTPVRFNALATMALAALAGLGVAGALGWLSARYGRPRALGAVAAIALVVLSVAVAVPGPVPLRPVETRATLPPAYRWLARTPPAPLLEVPFRDFDLAPLDLGVEALRLYRSVYHWHLLLNGYSGYAPATYPAVSALVRALPDPRALALLARAAGLRRILVHRAELSRGERRRWRARPRALRVARVFGPDVVLELRDPPPPDLLVAFRDGTPRASATALGTPLSPLPPPERRAELAPAAPLPAAVLAGVPFGVELTVTNASTATWPVLARDGPHAVRLAYRWEDERGRVLAADDRAGRLPWDLGPRERAPATVRVVPPPGEDAARLVVGVAQDGVWFAGRMGPVPIHFATFPAVS